MSAPLDDFAGRRAAEAADGLTALLRVVVRAGGRPNVPSVVVELLSALHAQAVAHERGSVAGTVAVQGETMVGVEQGLLASREAARRAGCSAEYVRRLARTGRISARRAGREWLIAPASLDEHFRGRQAS